MNRFTFEDLSVGQTAEFSRKVTTDMMDSFCEISGDVNPLHKDDDFARGKGYPGRVVYGMLTSSMYSCLAGVYIPGENCLLQSVHADFLAPVLLNIYFPIATLLSQGGISPWRVEKYFNVRSFEHD